MNRKHSTIRLFGRRAAIAAACLVITMMLGGCNALEGALLGGWFGAAAGGTGDAAVAGALLGAGIGAIAGEAMDDDYYVRREPREWYRSCDCPECRKGRRYDY